MVDGGSVIIAGSVITGIAGAVVALVRMGPDRVESITTYQTRIIDDVQNENVRLIKRNLALEEANAKLELRVDTLEIRVREAEDKAHLADRERADLERRLKILEKQGVEFDPSKMGTRSEDTLQ